RITSAFVSQKMLSFLARPNQADLTFLSELVDAGKLKPVIDHAYPLDQAADAMRQLESGRVTGKIVITVS
ncbi:MAG TPA: zinc-binding dehydrogenase, partial [Candidatus Sulfotelmatobacter sp.]|nr:zinc-binding dehydrogenase [Candidatus Sulfotelmatobacter sp.]